MFAERNQGCWQHVGRPGELVPAPACDLQYGRLTLAFGVCGVAMQATCSLALWAPPFVLCCPIELEQAVLAVPSSGSLLTSCSLFPVLAMAAVPSLLFLITKRGYLLLFSCIRSGIAWW